MNESPASVYFNSCEAIQSCVGLSVQPKASWAEKVKTRVTRDSERDTLCPTCNEDNFISMAIETSAKEIMNHVGNSSIQPLH